VSDPNTRKSVEALRARMIRASRADAPAQGEMNKRLVAMGLAPLGLAATAGSATATSLGLKVLWKWLLMGGLGGVAVVGIATSTMSDHEGQSPAALASPSVAALSNNAPLSATKPSPVASAEQREEVVSAQAAQPLASRGSGALSSVQAAVSTATTSSSAPTSIASAASSAATLTREIEILDQARSAIAQGDSAHGLEALNRYGAECKDAQLQVEATALRIEAMARTGSCQQARALGDQFLREHGRSAHAQKIRGLLETRCAPDAG
jgi:hypothetical protein